MARDQKWQPGGRMPSRRLTQSAFAFMEEEGGTGDPFPLAAVSPEALHGAICRWVGRGHAISFSCSGDQVAFGVHLVVNGDKKSKWSTTVAECEDFLSTIPGPDAA